ncbi:hypothetical protein Q5P01_000118 [Channa striata]|uniref:Uncharacterized protein n=1 Tax=Channa striata TaxID=64152 RepID=A0AA88ICF8_CHASR|nr:hypothetical protein Q5P01_000118 [Channa striata]
MASGPEDPGHELVNEYTLWLAVRGIERCEAIAGSPNQPLTLSEALEVYANLSREFVTRSREESLAALDSLQDFFALMLRYPVIPRLAADTKECPECYFETDITFDTWEETRRTLSCCHFTLRHESFAFGWGSTAGGEEKDLGLRADEGDEVVRADPCGNVFSATERIGDRDGGPAAAKFLEQLEWLKRRDEIAKQNALGKEISHQLASYSHTLEELEAPRYLSSHGPRWLYRMYGSLNRSRERARTLASPYSARHNVTAERVVLFKHLVASGLSVETSSSLLKSVSQARRGGMIGSPLAEGVERQLRKTARPTAYNRKIASLIWLFAHITAYCTLRELPHGYVLMGDSPQDVDRDGIYVFDQDAVGFRLSRRRGEGDVDSGRRGGEGAASACVPLARVTELLALRDIVHERLRR